MANYAVRVELKGNPSYAEYEKLHALMATKGFLLSVNGTDSKGTSRQFELPHATYYGSSASDCAAVRDALLSAVKAQIQDNVIVFVVQATTWAIGW